MVPVVKHQEKKKGNISHTVMFSPLSTLCQHGCTRWRWDVCINILICDSRELGTCHCLKTADVHWLVTVWSDGLLRRGALSMSAWLMGKEVVVRMTFQLVTAVTPLNEISPRLLFFTSLHCCCVTQSLVKFLTESHFLFLSAGIQYNLELHGLTPTECT